MTNKHQIKSLAISAILTFSLFSVQGAHAAGGKWQITSCDLLSHKPTCRICILYKRGDKSDYQCGSFYDIPSSKACMTMLDVCLGARGTWVDRHSGEKGSGYEITPPADIEVTNEPVKVIGIHK